jgi:hypothetical protein
MTPTTERMTVLPALPSLPLGASLHWCGEYPYSDEPRIEAWAKHGHTLLVSIYDPTAGRWGEWFPNEPAAA